jgi:transposase-like protein
MRERGPHDDKAIRIQMVPFLSRHHFVGRTLVSAVALSYRDLEEMMQERELHVDHTAMYRWAHQYAPELDRQCYPHCEAHARL